LITSFFWKLPASGDAGYICDKFPGESFKLENILEISTLDKIIRWLVILAIPVLLTVGTVRFLISWDNPSYPEFEYGRIAPDLFGFSDEERLQLAMDTMAYLRRSEPASEVIYMLEDLRIPGTDQPLYNEAEIGHMIDVKVVADAFKPAFWISGIIVAGGLIYLLAREQTRYFGAKTMMFGGLFTVALVLVVMIFMFLAWNLAFTVFHNIFFDAGTWQFSYTDSLIRLFPEQFWFDFGTIWTVSILVGGGLIALVGYLLSRVWA
jgi:integral membrane protein (TIGR01906 family)